MISMLKLPFRFSSHKVKNFACVEITSDYVRCLVLEPPVTVGEDFKVLGVSKVAVEKGFVRAGLIIDAERVSAAVKSAVLDAGKDVTHLSKEVIVSIAGELSICNITTVKMTRPDNTTLKKKEINAIYSTISQSSLENAALLFMQSTGNVDIKMELILSSDVYFKLDGVVVEALENKKGTDLEIAAFSSFSPKFNVAAVETVCKKAGLKLLGISPQLYGLALMLKKLKGEYFDGVVINISSDFTEVGIIFGGGLVATKTLAIGSSHFTKVISDRLGLSYKDAKLKKIQYINATLSSEDTLLLQETTSELLELWLDGIQLLFEEFEGVKTFSSKVYITGEDIDFPGLIDILSKEPWTKSIAFKAPPEYIKVVCEDFSMISDTTGKCVGGEFAPLLGVCNVYLFLKGMVE